ncbi:hypothetical protein QBC40DRAFT_334165 [Triangularia verruculosa]|uniref:Uncharacterized protein n=1 Tax=Triangularia verruculosa TaxID=2587418 RepID=A0AAN6XBJ5_9PEZI|nr:hypothetical protein QBC40DRAFT_334165 [Triangularia verruculosa]
MKTALLALSVGLASGQVLNNSTGILSNSSSSLTSPDFDINSLNQQLDLNNLNVNGLNLGNIDLGNQDAIVEAILAMLGGFCLGGQLNRNNVLGFGFNNDVDLFFQLAQLQQFQQLGFLNLGGVQNLFNKGKVLGGFNLGLFKREIADARKTMKRTTLRRGQHSKRQSCAQGVGSGASGSGFGGQEEAAFTIATAENPLLEPATATAAADFTIATADPGVGNLAESVSSADVEAVFSIATANPDVVVGAASVASASAADVAAATPAVAAPAVASPAVASASAVIQAFATITAAAEAAPVPASIAVPAAAETAVPTVAAKEAEEVEVADVEEAVDNLSDLTR